MSKSSKSLAILILVLMLVSITSTAFAGEGSVQMQSITFTGKDKLVIRLKTIGEIDLTSINANNAVHVGSGSYWFSCAAQGDRAGWDLWKCVITGITPELVERRGGAEVHIGSRVFEYSEISSSFDRNKDRSLWCFPVYDIGASGEVQVITTHCTTSKPSADSGGGNGDLVFLNNQFRVMPGGIPPWSYEFTRNGQVECGWPGGLGYYYDDCTGTGDGN